MRAQSVTLDQLAPTSAVRATTAALTDSAGAVEVARAAGATQLRVTDAFGNTATVALP